MLNFLLFYRLLIFNFLGFATVYYAYVMGYVNIILEKDTSGVVEVIVLVTLAGIFSTLKRGYQISKAINTMKEGKYVDILKAKKMAHKNEHIESIGGWAVLLGLLGNAIGFVIALSSKDALLTGAGTAFGSTVVGIACALWTEVNYRMLKTATAVYVEDVVGENRAYA
jgi:hypothetical protein